MTTLLFTTTCKIHMRPLLLSVGRAKASLSSRRAKSSAVKLTFNEYPSQMVNLKSKPLVVMHGLLGSSSNWTSMCKKLSANRNVYALDLRNHGHSPHVPDMNYQLMSEDLGLFVRDVLGNEKTVDILGHSMGGRVAMWTAMTNPELVNKMVVVDISPINVETESHVPIFKALSSIKFIDDTLPNVRKDAEKQLEAVGISDMLIKKWLVTNIIQDKTSRQFRWIFNLDAIYQAYKNKCVLYPTNHGHVCQTPTLFLAGANSDYLPENLHDSVRSVFPCASFIHVQGAGHWVHVEKPQEVLKSVSDFLED